MDKYEYQVCADQIKLLISERRYVEAMNIADTIDWRRVKSVSMLCTVSEIYKINKRYEESMDILLLAYDRYPNGRTIVYALCELAIKLNDIVMAVEYYKEFVQIAPEDTSNYILLYKIYEAQDVSLEERIEVLQEFKKRDYREKWAYELASLYHKTGQETLCVQECDELILWFGDGKFVKKAMELKMEHTKLTSDQQRKYEGKQEYVTGHMQPVTSISQQGPNFDQGPDAGVPQQIPYNSPDNVSQDSSSTHIFGNTADIESIQVRPLNVGMYNTMDLQSGLSEHIKEFFRNEQAKSELTDTNVTYSASPNSYNNLYENNTLDFPKEDIGTLTPMEQNAQELEINNAPIEQVSIPNMPTEAVNMEINQPTIPENLMVNNQQVEEPKISEPIYYGANMNQPTEVLDTDQVTEDTNENEQTDSNEDIGITTYIPTTEVSELGEDIGITQFMPVKETLKAVDNKEYTANENVDFAAKNNEELAGKMQLERMDDAKAQALENEIIRAHDAAPCLKSPSAHKVELEKTDYDKILSQELDGQIALSIPEEKKAEKNITGQLELQDVLLSWEEKKRENEQKRIEDAKRRSLQQTSDIMAQLKGVLPTIDDIAKPTPPKPLAPIEPELLQHTNPSLYKEIDFSSDEEKENILDIYDEKKEVPKSITGSIPDILPDVLPSSKAEEPQIEESDHLEEVEKEEATDFQPEEEMSEESMDRAVLEAVSKHDLSDVSIKEENDLQKESEDVEVMDTSENSEDDKDLEDSNDIEDLDIEKDSEELDDSSDRDNSYDVENLEEAEVLQDAIIEKSSENDNNESSLDDNEETAKGDDLESEEDIKIYDIAHNEESVLKNSEEDTEEASEEASEKDSSEDTVFSEESDKLFNEDDFDIKPIDISEEIIRSEVAKYASESKEEENEEDMSLTFSEEPTDSSMQPTSELPEYPYEGLDDYGEVEEMETIHQPELDGIMKTSDMPVDEIAKNNYERGIEDDFSDEYGDEDFDAAYDTRRHPKYMKLEKATVSKREFDKEEKRIFGRFESIEWMKAKLVEAIDCMSMDPSKGNVIVMGPDNSGRRSVAVDLVKVMQAMDNEFKGKVAKISGEALNKKDIPLTIKKLKHGALIVENAGGLTPSSARLIAEALDLESDPVLVVLEGSKEEIQPLIDASKSIMNRVFNARIELQAYSTDDLVSYGKGYAKEQEYVIDEMGVLALYTRIGDMQSLEHAVTLEEVREIIDNAIKHVDKKNMSHFMDVLFAKRYDDEDFIILREKDFTM